MYASQPCGGTLTRTEGEPFAMGPLVLDYDLKCDHNSACEHMGLHAFLGAH